MAGFSFFVHLNKTHHFYVCNNPMVGADRLVSVAVYEACK